MVLVREFRTDWIFDWRIGIPRGAVPIAAPFQNVAMHVEQSEAIWCE